jgi:hypothetical protein
MDIAISNKKRISEKEGLATEDHFKSLMLSIGKNCTPASQSQNIYDHIDFFIDGVSLDVKGNRHLNCIWLELTNVNGNHGWLRGKANYIAFDIKELNSFRFFKTKDLLKYCENITEKTSDKRDFNKIYTRSHFGRKDEIIKVTYKNISHLEKGHMKYKTWI